MSGWKPSPMPISDALTQRTIWRLCCSGQSSVWSQSPRMYLGLLVIFFFLQLKKVYIPPEAAIEARNKLNLPFDVSLRVVYLVVMYLDNRYIKIAFQQIPHKQTSKFGIRPKHDSPSSLG